MLEVTRLVSALVVAATVVACNNGDDSGTQPTTQTYTLAVANGPVTAAPGGTATQTVNITRSGGFTGAVALTASGLPTGVTAAFDPQSATGNSSTLTLTVAANATAGNATVTVKGTASGQTDKTTTFQLTVSAAPAGDFTLEMNPAAVTVIQGLSATSTINIARTGGFAGPVSLTASGLPNGVTASFDPTDATGATSTLTLTASATAAIGATTVTITGTSPGQTDQTTTLALTVNIPGSFSLTVDPKTLTIQPGTNGTATVTITRTGGFTGAVTLSATGLPNGVTATFDPAAPTTDQSTVTLTASAAAAIGSASVVIHGNGTGLGEHATTITLTVSPAASGSVNTRSSTGRSSTGSSP